MAGEQSPLQIGPYVLHYSSGKDTEDVGIALFSKKKAIPSYNIVVSPSGAVQFVVQIDYGDRIVYYIDKNGDGLLDEGVERSKEKGTYRKFDIQTKFIDKIEVQVPYSVNPTGQP